MSIACQKQPLNDGVHPYTTLDGIEQFLTHLLTVIENLVEYPKDDLLSLLAQCYISQSKYDEAEQLLLHELEVSMQPDASVHIILSVNNIFKQLTEVYLAKSNYEQAQFYYEQAIELWEQVIMQISLYEHDSDQLGYIINLILNNLPSIIKEYALLLRDTKKEHEAEKLEVYINELMSKYAHADTHSFHAIAIKASPFLELNEAIAIGDIDGERKVLLTVYNTPSPLDTNE